MTALRYLLAVAALFVAVPLGLAIAYGGGFHNIYVKYPTVLGYLLTALLFAVLYGLWRTQNRKGL